MNRLLCRNIKLLGASIVCAGGILTSSLAYAGGGYDHVQIGELHAHRYGYDGAVSVWGVLRGHSYDSVAVHVDVHAQIKDACINGGGKEVGPHTQYSYVSFEDYVYVGNVYDREKFRIDMHPYSHYYDDHYSNCPPGLSPYRTVYIDVVHVTVLRGHSAIVTGDCWFDGYDDYGYCDYDDYGHYDYGGYDYGHYDYGHYDYGGYDYGGYDYGGHH